MSNVKGSSFFLGWISAVSAALFVGLFAAFMSMWSVGDVIEKTFGETAALFTVGALFGALIGAGAGIGQAVALRNQGLPLGRWVIQTVVAGAAGATISLTLVFTLTDMETVPEVAAGLLLGTSIGLPISLAQWQIMKRHVAQANLWVLVSTAAYIIGFTAGFPLSGVGREWLAVGTTALLTAAISGLGMVVLVRGEETAVTV